MRRFFDRFLGDELKRKPVVVFSPNLGLPSSSLVSVTSGDYSCFTGVGWRSRFLGGGEAHFGSYGTGTAFIGFSFGQF